MKIRFSPLLAGMSGKAADAVAATWKGRAYIRKHVIPANPKSPAQVAVRESLARCITLWRSLSATIKAWLDTYGTGYRMSGYNVFISKNRALEQVPSPLVPVPANPNVPPHVDLAGTDGATESVITWTSLALEGFTKIALVIRDEAGNIFDQESLEIDDVTETHTFTELTALHVYTCYAWLYNPTTGEMGTISAATGITPTS